MIFWILLGLTSAAAIATYIYLGREEGFGYAILPAIGTVLLGGLVGVVVLAILSPLIPAEQKTTQTSHSLRAIGTSSSTSGLFFLGSGYVDGHRTLNYIRQVEDWSEIRSARADRSRVFEGTQEPSVTTRTHWYSNGWILPFEVAVSTSYDFHIPEGSILENYSITNE